MEHLDRFNFALMLFVSAILCGCAGTHNDPIVISEKQPIPEGLYFERMTESIVQVSWRDVSDSEKGYSVWLLKEGEDLPELLYETEQNQNSFIITSGLLTGSSYKIGVRTDSAQPENCSQIEYIPITMLPFKDLPSGAVISAESLPSCLSLTYNLRDYSSLSDVETGLCWSSEGKAVVQDAHLAGPELPSTGKVRQIIPNTHLEYGVTYNVRVYLCSSQGTYYVDAGDLALGEELSEVELNWQEKKFENLPEGIQVYGSIDANISGRPLRAWYATAPLDSGKYEFRTNLPESLTTIDEQAASFWGDCHILVNGGYFASGMHTGLAINDFKVSGSINNQKGTIDVGDPENRVTYPTTRGVFGVNDAGDAKVYWANGSGYNVNYFVSPVPSLKGEAKYPANPEEWASAEIVHWLPRAAISAAPVLLKDGKCPFDFTNTERGGNYYYTNFEFVADDIFGASVICDRTAVGVTADKRIVFFICDGRMDDSKGLNLRELASIMKGLGCVDALNLDGGGSTGMMVGDVHVGDTSVGGNRKVMSTVGLFRRR